MLKDFIVAITLTIVSAASWASSLAVDGAAPLGMDVYGLTGATGRLRATESGILSVTYLGSAAGYTNEFRFVDLSATEKALSQSSTPGITTISGLVPAGVLDFWFQARDHVGVSHFAYNNNDQHGPNSPNTSFAILGGGVPVGTFDYLLAFNDSWVSPDEPNYIDFLVGVTLTPSAVPLPAAIWLFGSALIGFVAIASRRKL